MHKKVRVISTLVVLAVVFTLGLYFGVTEKSENKVNAQSLSVSVLPTQPSNVDMSQFWQTWTLLEQNFVEVHASSSIPTDQEKVYGAISGLVASYGDPYTVFLPPSDATVFNQDIQGSFGGIGMEIDDNDQGEIVVNSSLPGTPAASANIRPGDVLTAIGTTTTEGMTADQAVEFIRGPVGTPIKLTFERTGVSQPIVVTLIRATINVPIVTTQARADGIFVITLYSFSENSADLFQGALRQFFESGDTKLVLDLRGNPGGYLDAAVDMASYFLPIGDTVVTEDFEGAQPSIVHRSLGYDVFGGKDLKMAILVDQGTASAAEILSGALQQHGVAVLVGTRTFGKGSVQELFDLGGGAEVKITVARWLTPDGTSISNGGLQPDIPAALTAANVAAGIDPQMQAAVDYLETH